MSLQTFPTWPKEGRWTTTELRFYCAPLLQEVHLQKVIVTDKINKKDLGPFCWWLHVHFSGNGDQYMVQGGSLLDIGWTYAPHQSRNHFPSVSVNESWENILANKLTFSFLQSCHYITKLFEEINADLERMFVTQNCLLDQFGEEKYLSMNTSNPL